ncbi:uncharacterized protein K02A2.6-like [Planococcus citri]|uniref:uncharacterized protein K02A2.6-like n=1 Tax=Planococcus citri TaxID=170843 RepID=UPI0031FA39F3
MYQVNTSSNAKNKLLINVNVNNTTILMEVDTRAEISAMCLEEFRRKFGNMKLEPADCSLRLYFKEESSPLGYVTLDIEYNGVKSRGKLYIPDTQTADTVIGRDWLTSFGLIKGNLIHINNLVTTTLNKDNDPSAPQILAEYSDVFDTSCGELKSPPANLQLVNDNVTPVCLKPAPLPYALRDPVEKELKSMEAKGHVRRVQHPEWGTPIVPVVKNGDIRICGNYKLTVNKHLAEHKWPIPKQEDIHAKMSGGKYLCKLDIQRAYFHKLVNAASAKLQTLSTHIGFFEVLRLMFGIKPAPNFWQEDLDLLFAHLKGFAIFFDDLKIQGKTIKEVLKRLRLALQICRENGIKLNRAKCQFLKTSIKYLGFRLDADGIHKTKEGIETIMKAVAPKNIDELQSLIGLIKYYGKFFPNLSTIMQPLNELTQKNKSFHWSAECEKTLKIIKKEISSDRFLTPYNPDLPLVISSDASSYGLGAVMSHIIDGEEKPIMFASRTLSKAEKGYSQIDKEVDHQPLTQILHPSKTLPALSATRMLHYDLFISGFNYDIRYRHSKANANADFCSRFPLSAPDTVDERDEDIFDIHFIESMNNLPVTVNEIQKETINDEELRPIFKKVQIGASLKNTSFSHVENQINIIRGCLVKGTRTIIPTKLQSKVLQELHSGHFGIQRMKSLAREFVYWQTINSDIENLVKACETSQKKLLNPKKRLIIGSMDQYHGCESILTSENLKVPNFSQLLTHTVNGSKLRKFHQRLLILQLVSCGKFFRDLAYRRHSFVARFLLSYRRTPHTTTGVSPAQLLLKRSIHSRINLVKVSIHNDVQDKQHNNLKIDRDYRLSSLQPGDNVLLRMYNPDRWEPGFVIKREGPLRFLLCYHYGTPTLQIRLRPIPEVEKISPEEEERDNQDDDDDNLLDLAPSAPALNVSPEPTAQAPEQIPLRRSSRNVKRPTRLDL